MTAKEQAKELVIDFMYLENGYEISNTKAKKCALIHIKKLIKELEEYRFNNDVEDIIPIRNLINVRIEIEKL